ncbi:pheromone-regulated membrane protein, putative [Talaromyces stipitatus ATCC 10500]|uniref:Pheromone-regulated membrane protein, putative n=1 Tax=Talaromyces stipitatus (strain ATCC 10500 / CBS 375.48 / QM 6759 / NRRL 1006) TaxID=441959 RepID=B8MRY0_TALSN|nr:pheromone-regulated membrane protein, putative [Talaromyces stipitatus ATCC 10500]EED13416.1 pheromone-regulated membrane protein, putative [Talaromyces stipitatus ATCC 10500]
MDNELRPGLSLSGTSTPERIDQGDITPDRSSVVFPDPGIPPEEIVERLREIRVKFRSHDEHMPAPEYGEDAHGESTPRDDMGADLEKGETAKSDASGADGKNGLTRHPRDALTPAINPPELIDDIPPLGSPQAEHQHDAAEEAHRALRGVGLHHGVRKRPKHFRLNSSESVTSVGGSETDSEPPPQGEGVLSYLLKLHAHHSLSGRSTPQTPDSGAATPKSGATTPISGAVTPRKKVKWYSKHSPNQSTMSLVGAGLNLGTQGAPMAMDDLKKSVASKREMMMMSSGKSGKKAKKRLKDHIAARIASIITRQRYLITLCRAMMRFGAPSHRLEEYMSLTAQVLDLHAQFLYLPGTMIISFDDLATRTTEVKLVRVAQGVDLARLEDTQDIYKNLVHDKITVDEAITELEAVINRPPKYPTWLVVLCYGFASVAVGPFAFQARPIDMPITFFLGCLLGLLQLVFSPRSSLYSNVFEVVATILTSFLARAFGSIRHGVVDGTQQYYFCFSSMAQSSIALILPGFLVLSSSLELQSHQIIPGSIRMVYAIIYSLFLGYGITVGTTIYGLMDPKANPNTTCSGELIGNNPYVQRFPFVAIYVVFLVIINQGKWKQVPVMILIAEAGYIVNYFSNLKLESNPELANTLGAFAIGVLGNLYSRIWHGHAATAILPAIFVLVPSGLASQGSLVSGVQSASAIRANITGDHSNYAQASSSDSSIYSMGYGMIQVAIGITVGLFLSAVVIYPLGKRRTGLFSF